MRIRSLSWLFAVLWIFIIQVDAQPPYVDSSEAIVYEQIINDDVFIITYDDENKHVYEPYPENCHVVSRHGIYIAEAAKESPSYLFVRNLETGNIVFQIEWQDQWMCNFAWFDTSDLRLSIRNDVDVDIYAPDYSERQYTRYDFSSGLLELYRLDYQPLDYSFLPNLYEDDYWELQFVLPAPNSTTYLYKRCPGKQIVDDDQHCSDVNEYIIYDVVDGDIFQLEDVAGSILEGVDVMQRPLYTPASAWSYDSRFLAYRIVNESIYDDFDLAIYDLQTASHLDTSFFNEQIKDTGWFEWSSASNQFLFQVRGRSGEDIVGDNYNTTVHPVLYDVDNQKFLAIDRPYDITTRSWLTWSPNGHAFVFTDDSDSLIHVDVNTGNSTVLDNNVTRIYSWRNDW